jgi:hypothetical protein
MWQHQQTVATCAIAHCRCYKVLPLLLRRLFIAIKYIATKNVVANSHFYNAFGLVPPNNIATPLIN